MLNSELDALYARRDYSGLSLAGAAMVRPILARMVRAGIIPGVDEELIGVGNLAVCEAVRIWEPASSTFGTYMQVKVRSAVLDHQRRESSCGITGRRRKDPQPIHFVYLDHLPMDEEADDE